MLLKYIMIFFLSVLLGGLITSAFVKDNNLNSKFPVIDQSELIKCDLIEFGDVSTSITSQKQFEELKCEYLLNTIIDFNHSFILVKPQVLTHLGSDDLDIVSEIINDSIVKISFVENLNDGPYPDLLGSKILYLEIRYDDLDGRKIISE